MFFFVFFERWFVFVVFCCFRWTILSRSAFFPKENLSIMNKAESLLFLNRRRFQRASVLSAFFFEEELLFRKVCSSRDTFLSQVSSTLEEKLCKFTLQPFCKESVSRIFWFLHLRVSACLCLRALCASTFEIVTPMIESLESSLKLFVVRWVLIEGSLGVKLPTERCR